MAIKSPLSEMFAWLHEGAMGFHRTHPNSFLNRAYREAAEELFFVGGWPVHESHEFHIRQVTAGPGRHYPYAQVRFSKHKEDRMAIVFQDPEMTTPHPYPITADEKGRLPPIYIGPEPVDVEIHTFTDKPILRMSPLKYQPPAEKAPKKPEHVNLSSCAAAIMKSKGDDFAIVITGKLGEGARLAGLTVGRTGLMDGTFREVLQEVDRSIGHLTPISVYFESPQR